MARPGKDGASISMHWDVRDAQFQKSVFAILPLVSVSIETDSLVVCILWRVHRVGGRERGGD